MRELAHAGRLNGYESSLLILALSVETQILESDDVFRLTRLISSVAVGDIRIASEECASALHILDHLCCYYCCSFCDLVVMPLLCIYTGSYEKVEMEDAVPFSIAFLNKSVDVFATLRPESALADLQKNPLAERAWITQEWLLSRRTIHFGMGELRWICRTKSETETGETFTDTSGTQRIHDALEAIVDDNES